MAVWPSTIPQAFIHDSFSESTQSAVVRTDMSAGPPKVRRRFTAVSDFWSGYMVMDSTELADFKTFYTTTTSYGSLSFDFPDQFNLTGPTVTARFKIDSGGQPYSISPDADTTDWQVSFTLEILP